MARRRDIKPGFFINEDLAELNPLGRLLFIGMWTIADRKGRLEDRPKKIKAELLPYDDCDGEELVEALHNKGFILRYSVDGSNYIQINNFEKHQKFHPNEVDSIIPPPPSESITEDILKDNLGDTNGIPKDNLSIPEDIRNNALSSLPSMSSLDSPAEDNTSELKKDLVAVCPEQPAAAPSRRRESLVFEINLEPVEGVVLPTKDGEEYVLPDDFATEMAQSFPELDIAQEVRRMRAWLLTNPAKRKLKKNMQKFISGWLNREVVSLRAGPSAGKEDTRLAELEAIFHDET